MASKCSSKCIYWKIEIFEITFFDEKCRLTSAKCFMNTCQSLPHFIFVAVKKLNINCSDPSQITGFYLSGWSKLFSLNFFCITSSIRRLVCLMMQTWLTNEMVTCHSLPFTSIQPNENWADWSCFSWSQCCCVREVWSDGPVIDGEIRQRGSEWWDSHTELVDWKALMTLAVPSGAVLQREGENLTHSAFLKSEDFSRF